MKALIIIDDRPIRKLAFSRAENLIKKIDKLEQDLDAFNTHDQQMFSSWFELTFRTERKRIAERRDAFRTLARFHNWIIGLAEQLDMSLPRAYVLLRQEEEDYAQGTDEVRALIDEIRKKRDEDLRKAFEQEARDRSRRDEPPEEKDDGPRDPREEAELEEVRQMSPKKLQAICASRDGAYSLLGMVMAYAETISDHELFLHVWSFVPKKLQKAFAKDFLKQMGFPLSRMLDEFKRRIAKGSTSDDSSETEFADDRLGAEVSKSSKVDHEATKILYRKLVRHLHPDLQEEGPSHWQKQIWHRVQDAYARNDQRELEKIYRLVLIRGRHLDELSVSEILESQNWLRDEFDQLAREAQDLRRRPAWGFSKKTDFASVKRKLEKPMKAELEQVDAKIRELEAEHAYLEMLSQTNLREDRHRRKRAKVRRRGRRR